MDEQSIVESLLVGGVAGAGLVLTACTLVVTRAHPMLTQRAQGWWESLKGLGHTVERIKKRTVTGQYEELRRQSERVGELADLPRYLTLGLSATFFLYCALSIGAALWLAGWNEFTYSQLLGLFVISTAVFLFSGLYAINDITRTLRMEFESRKRAASESPESDT